MKDRIKKLMESKQMSQKDFAQYLGISQGTLSSIFSERTQPTLAIANAIMEKFPNIQTDWLIKGTGSMFKSTTDSGQENSLFDFVDTNTDKKNVISVNSKHQEEVTIPKNEEKQQIQQVEQPPVITPAKKIRIKEVHIFFDDGTYETFEPK